MVYLDNNSTTAVDPRVLEVMLPYFTELYGNAASSHRFGVGISQQIKKAREKVAELICANSNEITFTSGATEAINLAIKGVAESNLEKGSHIVTVQTEHPAVLDTCKYLENKGIEVTYLTVDKNGIVSLDELKLALRKDTILVSVMLANNETGVIQPIKEIAHIAHEAGALFMTDATQAVGKILVNVQDLEVDILTFSAHKFYGPKGIGGLFIRHGNSKGDKPVAQLHGGGHESGLRSGTLNVPGIIGIGKAAELATAEMGKDQGCIKALRDELESYLLQNFNTKLNGHSGNRLYNTINLQFTGIDNDALLLNLKEIYVSNGSACSSFSIEPSHVLLNMGLTKKEANSSLRFSFGKFNTTEDVTFTKIRIKEVLERFKALNI
jgi:cysteine desulfurase